jgi:succinoglycan biosynthesis transport protein ExoP
MELRSYLSILWRRKLIIGITLLVTLAVVGIGSKLITPTYQASVTLRMATAARGGLNEVQYDLDYTDRLMNTYTHVAESGPVKAELMERFSLPEPPVIEVEILANTELLALRVEADSASKASEMTNALAEILIQQGQALVEADYQNKRQELELQLTQLEREVDLTQQEYDRLASQPAVEESRLAALDQELAQMRALYSALVDQYRALRTRAVIQANSLSILDPATPPLDPARPNLLLNLGLALILGSVAGLGLAFLYENLDSRMHSVEQIEMVTQLPMLARIPAVRNAQWPDIIMNSHSVQEEAFARLATHLAAEAASTSSLIVLVTSAEPGEGKSTVVANLASALGKAGHRVTAIDCNLYHPSLHTIFKLSNQVGLTDLLVKRIDFKLVAQPALIPNVHIIPSGEWMLHPAELFTPIRLNSLVAQVRTHPGIVLLDAPACLSAVDALALSTIADGVVFVVGQSIAHEEAVKLAHRELTNITTKLMGIVVTHTTQPMVYPYPRS